jgi:hypothetical protein
VGAVFGGAGPGAGERLDLSRAPAPEVLAPIGYLVLVMGGVQDETEALSELRAGLITPAGRKSPDPR